MHTLLSTVRGSEFTSANRATRRRSLAALLTTLLALSLQLLLPAQAQRFFGFQEPSEPSVLDRMKWVHPRLVANDLLDVGFFPEMNEVELNYIAVGREGCIVMSPDASCWRYVYLGDDLLSVTAGELRDPNSQTYKFYAGSRQARIAMWHLDTRGWGSRFVRSAPQVNGNFVDFLGVAYGGDRLVVATSGGYAGMTQNTVDWHWTRATPTGVDGDLVSLAYRSGRWVAATETNLVVYSRDGTNWFPSRIESPLKRVRATSSGFLGISVDQRIATSADGQFWSFVEAHKQGAANDVAGFSGEIVLVGDDSLLSSSATLTEWKKIGSPVLVTNFNFNAITKNPSLGVPFVAVGDRGTILHYTAGAAKAVSANNDIIYDLYSVAYGEGAYAAVGLRGTIWSRITGTNGALYAYMNDGGAWTARGSGITNDLTGVAFGKKRFIAVGGNSGVDNGLPHATILSSQDTITWAPVLRQSAIVDPVSGKKAYPKTVVFGGGKFVALAQGEGGAALVSNDGSRWETQFDAALDGMQSIGYGNGVFIAVGNGIATSPDGFVWTLDPDVTGVNLTSATGGKDVLVAVGGGATSLLVKTNGGKWTVSDAISGDFLTSVIYAVDHFVAVGANGNRYSSVDGLAWDQRVSFTLGLTGSAQFTQRGIAYGNQEYAMVGDRGDISVSPKVDPILGLPAPIYNVSTAGGVDQDSVNGMSFTATYLGEYITVGASRKVGTFGSQTLGDATDTSSTPTFFLARHSDTGTVNFAASGPLNSIGTHVSYLSGSVIAAGLAFDGTFPAFTTITSGGVGFVAQIDEFSGYTYQDCYQKILTSRTDDLLSVGNWVRHFDGTVTDLKQLTNPDTFNTEIRFAGVFQQALDMGESITIDSTNTPRSFFLTKVNSFSGINAWVRWFEPTNMAPTEPLYGLKLATDAAGNTVALGAVSGGVNIFSNVPPDTGTDPAAAAAGARSGRPALADACPSGHSASSSALEGNPCEEACPPGHSPTLSTLLGSPCSDGGGSGGDTNEAPTWVKVGTVPVSGHAPGLAMFLSIFDVNGAFIWAGNIGPVGSVPVAVETDGDGIIYVAANKNDGSMFVGAYQSLSRSGVSNLWSKSLNFGGGSQLTALHVRENGLVMVSGTFQNSVTIEEPDTIGSTNLLSGGTASFVLRISTDGKIRSAHAVGTADQQSGFSVVNAIHSLSDTRAVLGGYFVQKAKFGDIQVSSKGLGDAYVATVELTDPPKAPPVQPSPLVITKIATGIRLEWTTDSILQKSSTVNPANWVDLDVTSPLDLPVGASVQLYRLRSK